MFKVQNGGQSDEGRCHVISPPETICYQIGLTPHKVKSTAAVLEFHPNTKVPRCLKYSCRVGGTKVNGSAKYWPRSVLSWLYTAETSCRHAELQDVFNR